MDEYNLTQDEIWDITQNYKEGGFGKPINNDTDRQLAFEGYLKYKYSHKKK